MSVGSGRVRTVVLSRIIERSEAQTVGRSRRMEGEAMALRLNSSSIFRHILCAVVVLSLCGAMRLGAQAVGGTILGTVTDPTGGAVPKADVTITNTATGVKTTVTTSPEGFYSVPNLLPGTYTVAAKSSGFSTSPARTGFIRT